ncbi:hypothetical protein ABGB16_26045 [Micromonospora sp. B11E3]|uniref:hypothetical protein n=1 Tax=Micromonospora sp. B11E3 TaxID=3153562 RepID=UPI00325ECA5A
MKIDDTIRTPQWRGTPPLLTDSELVCLAVAQVLLGARSEAHWIRYARIHLRGMSPYLLQPGYNKATRRPAADQEGDPGPGPRQLQLI